MAVDDATVSRLIREALAHWFEWGHRTNAVPPAHPQIVAVLVGADGYINRMRDSGRRCDENAAAAEHYVQARLHGLTHGRLGYVPTGAYEYLKHLAVSSVVSLLGPGALLLRGTSFDPVQSVLNIPQESPRCNVSAPSPGILAWAARGVRDGVADQGRVDGSNLIVPDAP